MSLLNVSILSGLMVEKIYELFFCRDKGNCPLYTGVHTEWVSIEQGSSVLLCKKIIVHLKEKCKLEK